MRQSVKSRRSYFIPMEYFNAKLGKIKIYGDFMGRFGIELKNEKEKRSVEFATAYNLYKMNT